MKIDNIFDKTGVKVVKVFFEGGNLTSEDIKHGMIGKSSMSVVLGLLTRTYRLTQSENDAIENHVEELLDRQYKNWDSGVGNVGTTGCVEITRLPSQNIHSKLTVTQTQQVTTTTICCRTP